MDLKSKSVEFQIPIDHFRGSYAWGVGARESFLNNLALHLRGTITSGPTLVGKIAIIDIEALKGEEPSSYDKEWFNETVAIGQVNVGGNTLRVHANVARSGIQFMLNLLNSSKEAELVMTCLPLEDNGFGGQKSDLLRISLDLGR
ncbi:MAG: hypothetical protein U5S82_19990 [Gammaproteobacteria bacterium]|nr:hypothetical protein [Gammaproteobacteria bacterium]